MKKLAFLIGTGALCLSGAVHAQAYERYAVDITNAYHPSREPAGLYVVDFQVTNNDTGNQSLLTYRVYCPTKNVRNISNAASRRVMRTAIKEDAAFFQGIPIMQDIVRTVCRGNWRSSSSNSGLPQ